MSLFTVESPRGGKAVIRNGRIVSYQPSKEYERFLKKKITGEIRQQEIIIHQGKSRNLSNYQRQARAKFKEIPNLIEALFLCRRAL